MPDTITLLFNILLTTRLRESTAERDKYIASINADIASELEITPSDVSAIWNLDVTGHSLLLRILVPAEDARFLEVALHNLHQAKLIN